MNLTVKLDVSQLVNRMEGAAVELLKGLRNAVDRSARAARKDALNQAAADIGGGLRMAKTGMPLVKASSMGNLTASWTVPSKFTNATKISGMTLMKGVGLKMSTYRETGGPSANLLAPHAFGLTTAAGVYLAMLRTKHGKGTHRGGLRAVSAEMTRTSMEQQDGAAAIKWKRTATELLATSAAAAVQTALDGGHASSNAGSD